ncbi:MAG: hypothetical protein JJU13_12485 [Balneolaceae bacterium]|nr:hypothetical protein [Balneolaceae bacterium]
MKCTKFHFISAIICCMVLLPVQAKCQQHLDLLKEMLDRKISQEIITQERKAEIENFIIESRHRTEANNLNFIRTLYNRNLNQLNEQIITLNTFNIGTPYSLENFLPGINQTLSPSQESTYYIEIIPILNQIVNYNFEVISYLNSGAIEAGIISDDDAMDYFEKFENRSDDLSFLNFRKTFFMNYLSQRTDLPDNMRDFYIIGIEKELLSEIRYDKIRLNRERRNAFIRDEKLQELQISVLKDKIKLSERKANLMQDRKKLDENRTELLRNNHEKLKAEERRIQLEETIILMEEMRIQSLEKEIELERLKIDTNNSVIQSGLENAKNNKFQNLEGTSIVSENGTFLGKITKNLFDINSISNSTGPYGNRNYSPSIFNRMSIYGGTYSQYSPFSTFATNPPKIYNGDTFVGYLTINRSKNPRFDTNELLEWLNMGK